MSSPRSDFLQFMIYARSAQVPPASRDGPAAHCAVVVAPRRSHSPVRLAARLRGLARRASHSAEADARRRYLELEFAVGFSAEDELPGG